MRLDQIEQLADGYIALLDLVAQVATQREDRCARHPMQKRRVQRLGDDPVVTQQEEVCGAGFLNVSIRAEEHLVDAKFFFGIERWAQRCRVVPTRLGTAELPGRSRPFIVDQQR